jgi:membrane associated rhomboid family serine protease
MRQASVGFHCPDCTKQGAQKVINPRALFNRRPLITQILIGINVAVFIAGVGAGLQTKASFVQDGGLFSANIQGFTFGIADGEWWRIVTSGFLHVNVIHIALNMLALYRLGQLVEPVLGRLRFALAYAACLLTGSLGALIVSPDRATVGASGAVFGLMGVTFMVLRARGIDPFTTGIATTIAMNLVITFTLSNYISVGGHVGGLAGGFLVGWILTDVGPRFLKDDSLILGTVVAVAVVAAGAAVLVGMAV